MATRRPGAKQIARNQRAQSLGFKNDYDYRKAVNAGKIPALRPERIKKTSTAKAQRKYYPKLPSLRELLSPKPSRKRPAAPSYTDIVGGISKEDRCRDWQRAGSRTTVARYDLDAPEPNRRKNHPAEGKPEWQDKADQTVEAKREWIKKHGKKQYTDAYFKTWVDGEQRYAVVRHKGGSDDLRQWLVEVTGYLSQEDYDEKYSIH